eukprot:TRINITY_DN7120_c0_g1_i3.p1 TRINITY_DN7120_c0_g1~~TRINITY_DN7120_c0_g1_i3.p1  ORF type:complete len:182 (-),score=38.44 TRINITY_DN7120_c0_g1_i3:403-948(-)
MSRLLSVLLVHQPSGIWASAALALPDAFAVAVKDVHGQAVSFVPVEGGLQLPSTSKTPLFADVQIPDKLITADSLDKARLDLDAEKLRIEERAGRRTLWFTLGGSVLSGIVSIVITMLTHGGGSPGPTVSYKDLQTCKNSLDRLGTLSALPMQTVDDLRSAIQRHKDSCEERLNNALLATQ